MRVLSFAIVLSALSLLSCSTKQEERIALSHQEQQDTSGALQPVDTTTQQKQSSGVTEAPRPPIAVIPRTTPPGGSVDSTGMREVEPGPDNPFSRSAPIGSAPLVPAEQLAELHPKLPDYAREKIKNKELPTIHSSVAVLRSKSNPEMTIRSSIFDQDERTSYMLIEQISALRTKGQLTQHVDGEPVTAYYVQVAGVPGAKAYIPSKQVATLTFLLSDHTLLQLREDKVRSADHLMEVAKTIDFKKFDAFERALQK